ncbi:MAG: GAF and ANTAR domain-containing protein [Acidimicrobiales bacterium]
MAESTANRFDTRESLAARTFVQLVDSLVDDFDVIDLLTVLADRSVELLDAGAAGILLADTNGRLRVIGASSEQVELLELFQLQNDEGPCLDCYATGEPVINADLRAESPWHRFAAESVAAGFPSVCALPLRLKDTVLGCLNLFMVAPRGLSEPDLALAQALADVASITIVQDQAMRQAAVREGQLQYALDSRVAIEQAKGMLAERGGIDMDEAFSRLRSFARTNNRRLTELAMELVEGTVSLDVVVSGSRPSPERPRSDR